MKEGFFVRRVLILKRLLSLLLIAAMLCPYAVMNVNAVSAPAVYFDLDFRNDQAVDAKGNAAITQYKGSVETMTVVVDGKVCNVPVYKADKWVQGSQAEADGHSYLDVALTDITDYDAMKEWIFQGITFECMIWVDEVPTETCGYMTDLYSGGIGLYSRKYGGELNFQIGSNNHRTATYHGGDGGYYATAFPWGTTALHESNYETLNAGMFTHVVGTYDPVTNRMSLYKDGVLLSSGNYSTGGEDDFRLGNAKAGHIGLGTNIAYLQESMDRYTSYAIADARIYAGALTPTQVVTEYSNRIRELQSGAVAALENSTVSQLDDLSGYASLTGRNQTMAGLPAYVYGNDTYGKYLGSKEGRYGLNTHVFADTYTGAYLSWLKSLEAAGWSQYSNNIIDGKNLFATYTKNGESVYAYYIANKHRTYIITSPDTLLEPRKEDNAYTKVCEPQLTQLRLKSQEQKEGMSYVLRLADGRFIIVDGGWNELDYYQAKDLYDLLEEQNVLNKITVAAWIISHPHGDHLGTPADFFKIYDSGDLLIESVIYNFPTDQDGLAVDSTLGDTTSAYADSRMPAFLTNLETYWPDTNIITCHTGQKYYYADATLEFLHTIEDYYPKAIASLNSNALNGSSAVFTIEIGGQKTMMLGDCSTDESNDLVDMWDDYLKCDIMQLSHHGYRGATLELYQHIDPQVALMPTALYNWNYVHKFEPTKWVLENRSGNIKEIIYAGMAERVLEMPYYPEESTELISNKNLNGYIHQEAPYKEVAIPEPYMDLGFNGTSIQEKGTGDITLTMNGGTVGNNTVYYGGEAYQVQGYRGETAEDFIHVKLNEVETGDDLKDLLLNGSTFETFIALDEPTMSTAGLIANANGGGVALYVRMNGTSVNFQIGNSGNDATYSTGSYSSAMYYMYSDGGNVPGGKNVVHILGSYDPVDNMLRVYINGVLISEGTYGSKDNFKLAAQTNSSFNELGIGINTAYPSEAIGAYTGYTVLRSRIYDTCLTQDQISAEYWDCVQMVTGELDVSITSDAYGITDGTIHKIPLGTTVAELIDGINEDVRVFNGSTEVSADKLAATGMTVKLMNGETVLDAVTVMVTGDINGDGKTNIADMLAIKSHLLHKSELEGLKHKAADINGDKKINITDFILTKAYILKKGSITAR